MSKEIKLKQAFARVMHTIYDDNVPLRVKAEFECMFMAGALHVLHLLSTGEPEVNDKNREALAIELAAFVEALTHRSRK